MAYLNRNEIYKSVEEGGFGFSRGITGDNKKIFHTHMVINQNTQCIVFSKNTPQEKIIEILSSLEITSDKSIQNLKPTNNDYRIVSINETKSTLTEDLTQIVKDRLEKNENDQPSLMSKTNLSTTILKEANPFNHFYRAVKLLDYNLGAVKNNPKNKLFAEVEILDRLDKINEEYAEDYFYGYGLTYDMKKLPDDRYFIIQDHLIFDKNNAPYVNYGKEKDNPIFISKYQTYKKRLKQLKEWNKKQAVQNYTEWEENFINLPSSNDQEWYFAPSSVVRDGRINQLTGQVFYNKKYASYCVSVILNISKDLLNLEDSSRKDIFSVITEDDKRKILKTGLETISDFLNIYYNEGATTNFVCNLAEVLDINIDQTKKDQKIKFLVSIPHRKIAARINELSQVEIVLNATQALTFLDFAKGGSSVWKNVVDEIFNSLPDAVDPYLKSLREEWLISNRQEELDRVLVLFKDYLNSNLSSPLADLITNVLTDLFSNSDPLDIPIDINTPYLFIGYSPEIKNSSQEKVKLLVDGIKSQEQKYTDEVLSNYEVEPGINFSAISNKCQSLYDNLYDYSINKIMTAESIGESSAQEKILGTAIYFFGTYEKGWSLGGSFFSDLPDWMKVIGIDIFYKKNGSKNPKILNIGSSKQSEISKISELSEKEVLFLLYNTNRLINKKTKVDGEEEDNPYYINDQDALTFAKDEIKPARNFIWTPKGEGDDTVKCLENIRDAFANELARQTASARESALKVVQGFSASWDKFTKPDFSVLAEEIGSGGENIIPTILANVDVVSLMSTLIECLKKKGIPYEELKALIDFILELVQQKTNIFCLLPPIKLPQLPIFDFNINVSTVDVLGAIYKEVRKQLFILMNSFILEIFKALLNGLLQCDDTYPQSWDQAVSNVFSPRNQPKDSKKDPLKDTNNVTTTTTVVTETTTTPTGEDISPLLDYNLVLEIVLQDILPLTDSISSFVAELIQLIEFIVNNINTAELLNLLTGKLNNELYWLIRDEVESSNENKYPTIDKSGLLKDKEKTRALFLRLGTLLSQEFINEMSNATVQLVTDVNILCGDNQNQFNIQSAVAKYGEEKANLVKEKFFKTQLETISLLEKLLSGANLADFLPPIKSKINPDGSVTPGLLPDTPNPSMLNSVSEALDIEFNALKKNFNEEIAISKFSQISNVVIKQSYSTEQAKAIYNIEEWNEERDAPKRTFYTNKFIVNESFKKSLNEKYKKDFNRIKKDFYYLENIMPIPSLSDTIEDFKDPLSGIEGGPRLLEDLQRTNGYLSSIKLPPNFIKLEIEDNIFKLNIQNTKLFGVKEDNTYNEVTIIGSSEYSPATEGLLKIISYPENFGTGTKNSITVSRILYNNNIDINIKKHNFNFQYDKDVLEKLYFLNYEKLKQKVSLNFIDDINKSKLLNLDLNSKLNILNLKLESDQSKFCLRNGFKDTHLLGLEEEKEKILEYYSSNSWKSPLPPSDGSETEELNAMMFARLVSYINIYFKIFVHDMYLRGYYVFNSYSPLDINQDIMLEFLYNVFLNDKYCKKLLKYTKDGKFIKLTYEKMENKEFTSLEESIKYYIKKSMNFVSEKLTKKLLKNGFKKNNNDIFNNFWYNLPLIIVNDDTKKIRFSTEEELEEASKGSSRFIDMDNSDVFFAKIKKNNKYYLGSLVSFVEYSQAALSFEGDVENTVFGSNVARKTAINMYTSNTKNGRYLLNIMFKLDIDEDNGYIIDPNSQRNKLVKQVFNDIFAPANELTFLNIGCITQSSLTKDVDIIFNNSKIKILRKIEYLVFNGYDYISEDANSDESSFELSLVIKAALNMPPFIIKGIAEAVDPNIAFSSKIVLAIDTAKQFIASLPGGKPVAENIPKIALPLISLPIGFTLPFILSPLTLAYLALWTDENENINNQENKSLDLLYGSDSLCICDIEPELDEDISEYFRIKKEMLTNGLCVPPPLTKNYVPPSESPSGLFSDFSAPEYTAPIGTTYPVFDPNYLHDPAQDFMSQWVESSADQSAGNIFENFAGDYDSITELWTNSKEEVNTTDKSDYETTKRKPIEY